jgi:CarD family transcriptional regulator
MHPSHGAGQVVDTVTRELVDGFKDYYVIQFANRKMKLFLPVERAEEIGLRGVIGAKRLNKVWETLRGIPQNLPSHFRSRKARIEGMLNSGKAVQVAEAVRELTWRKQSRSLCQTDMDLLARARKRLKSEVMMASQLSSDGAEAMIRDALDESMATQQAQA